MLPTGPDTIRLTRVLKLLRPRFTAYQRKQTRPAPQRGQRSLFGRLFGSTNAGELASLCGQYDRRPNEDHSERRAQASRRYAVNAGPDDCRCFVHGATFSDARLSPFRWSGICV